jgi:hypothetical protein
MAVGGFIPNGKTKSTTEEDGFRLITNSYQLTNLSVELMTPTKLSRTLAHGNLLNLNELSEDSSQPECIRIDGTGIEP